MTIDHVRMWCLQMAIEVSENADEAIDAAERFYGFITVDMDAPQVGDTIN